MTGKIFLQILIFQQIAKVPCRRGKALDQAQDSVLGAAALFSLRRRICIGTRSQKKSRWRHRLI